jgi:hypothetical protein
MKTTKWGAVALVAMALVGQAQVYLREGFNYPDGRLVDNAGSGWSIHSAGANPLNVVGGTVLVHQPDTTSGREDANHLLVENGSPVSFPSTATGSLYARFDVTFSALPTGPIGSYFAHFRTDAGSEFYGRVGAGTANAAPGAFRLALANEAWNTTIPGVQWPQDLALGVSYTVVTRLNLDTKASTLWLNPVDESSPSISAVDLLSWNGNLNTYALRQGTSTGASGAEGPGDIRVDNLVVARTFSEATAVPEPHAYALLLLGLAALGYRYRHGPRSVAP